MTIRRVSTEKFEVKTPTILYIWDILEKMLLIRRVFRKNVFVLQEILVILLYITFFWKNVIYPSSFQVSLMVSPCFFQKKMLYITQN